MNAQRNEKKYLSESNTVVECFLGNPFWRDAWSNAKCSCTSFSAFLVDSFSRGMVELKYKPVNLTETVLVRQPDNRAPLYRLAFYSRSDRGKAFWKQTRKYSEPQLQFDFMW